MHLIFLRIRIYYTPHEAKIYFLSLFSFHFLQELKFTMRRRAISVDLIPEVEDECIIDLTTYCSEKTERGEEMQCLQDNLDKLQEKCKVSVYVFSYV